MASHSSGWNRDRDDQFDTECGHDWCVEHDTAQCFTVLKAEITFSKSCNVQGVPYVFRVSRWITKDDIQELREAGIRYFMFEPDAEGIRGSDPKSGQFQKVG